MAAASGSLDKRRFATRIVFPSSPVEAGIIARPARACAEVTRSMGGARWRFSGRRLPCGAARARRVRYALHPVKDGREQMIAAEEQGHVTFVRNFHVAYTRRARSQVAHGMR